MKFIIHELKMWFNNKSFEPKSYKFESNKVNVITGDSTKGKSSVISIIDYCLAAKKSGISDDIRERVSWFGIVVSINNHKIAIARSSTHLNDYYLNEQGTLPEIEPHKTQQNVPFFLNGQFGLNLVLSEFGINVSFRNILSFCSVSEKYIDNSDEIIDRKKFDIDDKNFQNTFYPALGVNLLKNNELSTIEQDIKTTENKINNLGKLQSEFRAELFALNSLCEHYNLKDDNKSLLPPDDYELFKEIEETYNKIGVELSVNDQQEVTSLLNRRNELQLKIRTYEKYKKEYKKLLDNAQSAQDSLLPIETLKNKYDEEIADFYDTKQFVNMLSESLISIKKQLNMIPKDAIDEDYETVIEQYKEELVHINNELNNINESQNIILDKDKLVAFGQVKYRFEILKNKIPDYREYQNMQEQLQSLNEKKHQAKKEYYDINNDKRQRLEELNGSMSYFAKQFEFKFKNGVRLKFEPQPSKLYLYDGNVLVNRDDSMAIRVYTKLSFHLGMHLHCLNIQSKYVPSFLILDYPCIPFGDTETDNIQKDNIFKILNHFMEKVNEMADNFQLIVLEHADESYWNGKYENFHTVAKFIDGEGLLPKELF